MLPPETQIGAVTLRVAQLEKMIDFYSRIIGLEVHAATPTRATLGTAVRPLVNLIGLKNGRFIQRATGLYHLAIRLPTRADLGQWLRHYARRNAPFWQGASDHGVSEAVYLTDPEGNGIELYADTPPANWTYAANGQIVAFAHRLDVDELIQRAPSAPWRGMPSAADMGHIHLKVDRLDRAEQFYVNLLGFELKTAVPPSALFVAAGSYHHHVGLNTWQSLNAPPLPADGYGLAAAELLYPHADALRAGVARLETAVSTLQPLSPDRYQLMDPAGNCWQLTTLPASQLNQP